jgi:hypothetical protein
MKMLRYLGLSSVFLALIATTAHAGFVSLAGTAPGNISVPVTSLKEARFLTTLRQQYDFSCGSAAMATLLTYHYDHPVTEQEVFLAMYEQGDKEKIRIEGFSLLDMKKYLDQNGFRAEGYRASLDQMSKAGIPAVALIKEAGYNHFVLIKGIRDGKLLIGDPAIGTRIISRTDFEQMWTNGILFAISNSKTKNNFNRTHEWLVRAPAPINRAMLSDTSASINLMRPGSNDF